MRKPRGKHSYTPCTHRKELKAANSAGGLQCTAGAPGDRRREPRNTEYGARFWATCPRRHVLVCLLTSHSLGHLFLRRGVPAGGLLLGHSGTGPPGTCHGTRGPPGNPRPTRTEGPLSGRRGAVRALGAVLEKLVAGQTPVGSQGAAPGGGRGRERGMGRGPLLAQSDRSTAQHVIISQRLIAVRRVNPV